MPHHSAPQLRKILWYRNVKIRRERYITIIPQVNASTTDSRIAAMIPSARSELIYSPKLANVISGLLAILKTETAIAEPNKQKISDTVVDVGRPHVLYRSSRMMLANITPKYNIITSWNVKSEGSNIPLRATSIIPLDVTAPMMIPIEAIIRITFLGAAFEPIAELRKLTASLVTPTNRPATARMPRTITINV